MAETTHYSFRLKLRVASGTYVMLNLPRLQWEVTPGRPAVFLSSGSDDRNLCDADHFYIMSHGWPTQEAAHEAAQQCVASFFRAFARLRIGVDVGTRGPAPGGFTHALLDKLWTEYGARVINEASGIMVYETEPQPMFASASISAKRCIPGERFQKVVSVALEKPQPLQAPERVALDLFNASFFQTSADARLLMLVFSIETLVNPQPLSEPAIVHIDHLVALTQQAPTLAEDEKQSLVDRLRLLRRESIRQAGMRYVELRLAGKTYMGKCARDFFDYCYNLRSRLAHGADPLPAPMEVGSAAASLEVMVSDLLAGELSEVDLETA